MYLAVALTVAFLIPMLMIWLGASKLVAWLTSIVVLPAFVLLSEFVLPYEGGGASMWPIALVVGGVEGAVAGGVGTLIASALKPGQNGSGKVR